MKSTVIRRILALALATLIAISAVPLSVASAFTLQDIEAYIQEGEFLQLTEDGIVAFEQLQFERLNRGLRGFIGDYALPEDGTPVSIIVIFEHSPADVQVIEAGVRGEHLPLTIAERIVEDEHTLFRNELTELFANQPGFARGADSYSVTWEYRRAMSGVAMTLPADMVGYVALFDSVRVIYPNSRVSVGPINPVSYMDYFGGIPEAMQEDDRNPFGMRAGRARMRADEMHNMGIKGEGVLIAVMDTGIDYYHPAFVGSFITMEEMHSRGATHITPDHLLEINGGNYFVGRDFISAPAIGPAGGHNPTRGPAYLRIDPMESSPINFPDANPDFFTSHGTHVAGTIAGRDVGDTEAAILGVAPKAQMIHYRVLGLAGNGNWADIVAGLNMIYYDRPDIVNMSLGGGADPTGPHTVAVNNIALSTGTLFIISAGNAGERGYFSVSEPSHASAALSISNIAEPGFGGFRFEGGGMDINMPLLVAGVEDSWYQHSESGNWVSQFPTAVHDNGEFKLFAMPVSSESPVGGQVGNAHVRVGAGISADFDLLFEQYDPTDLEGAFVLVRRGYSFDIIANEALDRGLGGVISVNTSDQPIIVGTGLSGREPTFPFFMVQYGANWGLGLVDNLIDFFGGQTTFAFTETVLPRALSLSYTSSRGPAHGSFEINPSIGAHGTGVFSAVPWWTVGAAQGEYVSAYALFSGTSMSAPHVSGGAALLMDFSENYRGGRWEFEEIKARIMNTGLQLDYQGLSYSVFDMGSGQIDVYAAAFTDTVVLVDYDRVVTQAGIPMSQQEFTNVKTGAFSFGEADVFVGDTERTLTAYIHNYSNQGRTYQISYRFIYYGSQSLSPGNYASMSLSQTSVFVPAGGSASFDATINIAESDALGFYEGFIEITHGNDVISMPFGAVAIATTTPMINVVTYRDVISTSRNAVNPQSSEIGIFFETLGGFAIDMWVMRDVPDIDTYNWWRPEFNHAFMGYAGTRYARGEHITHRETYRGVIFLGEYMDTPQYGIRQGPIVDLTEEGDFILVIEVFEQFMETNYFSPYEDIFVRFSVDNTIPEFSALNVGGFDIYGESQRVETTSDTLVIPRSSVTPLENEDIVIVGNVYDEWLNQAIVEGRSFGIWCEDSLFGSQLSVQDNLALYFLVGENEESNRPQRIEIESTGDFEIIISNEAFPIDISLWLMDGYSVIPVTDAWLGTSGVLGYPYEDMYTLAALPHFEMPGGLVQMDPALTQYVRTATTIGFHGSDEYDFYAKAWSGLNLNNLHIRLLEDDIIVGVREIVGVPTQWVDDVLHVFDVEILPVVADFTVADIIWSISPYNTLAASISNVGFTAYELGELIIRATIPQGSLSENFVQDFRIEITEYLYVTISFDGNGGLVRAGSLDQIMQPEILTEYLGTMFLNEMSTMVLMATGTPPIHWTWRAAPDSQLPLGVSLSTDGIISGIPSVEGLFDVIVRAEVFGGLYDERQMTLRVADGDREITHYFVDGLFEGAVRSMAGVYFGPILYRHVHGIAIVDLSDSLISDISGIEHFTNLIYLNITLTDVVVADLTNNYFLRYFNAIGAIFWWQMPLERVYFPASPHLHYVRMTHTPHLQQVDISRNPSLRVFDINSGMWIELVDIEQHEIDLTNNPLLEYVNVSARWVDSIDLTNNPYLRFFVSTMGTISEIDLSNNPLLEEFNVFANHIRTIDVTNNRRLFDLNVIYNLMESYDDVVGREYLNYLRYFYFNPQRTAPGISQPDGPPPVGTVGHPFWWRVEAVDFAWYLETPYWTWSADGTNQQIPPGLSLTPYGIEGEVIGTPTQAGEFTFILRVESVAGYSEEVITITIQPDTGEPTILTPSVLPDVEIYAWFDFNFTAAGSTPIEWSIVDADRLPAGVTMDQSGLLTGAATELGEFTFEVMAENIYGNTVGEFTLNVVDAVAFQGLDISPRDAVVFPGSMEVFFANPSDFGMIPVSWSLSGNNHPGTVIAPAFGPPMFPSAMLDVDIDETAEELTITATAQMDNQTFTDSVTVIVGQGIIVLQDTDYEEGAVETQALEESVFEDVEERVAEDITTEELTAEERAIKERILARRTEFEGIATMQPSDPTFWPNSNTGIATFNAIVGVPRLTVTMRLGESFDEDIPYAIHEIYEFIGWNTRPDGSGEDFDRDTQIWSMNTVLYAQYRVRDTRPPPYPPPPPPPEGYRNIRIYYYVIGEDGELYRDVQNNPAGRPYIHRINTLFDLAEVGVLDRNTLDSSETYVFAGWIVFVDDVYRLTYLPDMNRNIRLASFMVPVPQPDTVGLISLVATWSIYETDGGDDGNGGDGERPEQTPPPPSGDGGNQNLPGTGIESNVVLLWALLGVALLGATITIVRLAERRKLNIEQKKK